jgi:hypothetical protein
MLFSLLYDKFLFCAALPVFRDNGSQGVMLARTTSSRASRQVTQCAQQTRRIMEATAASLFRSDGEHIIEWPFELTHQRTILRGHVEMHLQVDAIPCRRARVKSIGSF